jgi:hypothetical protein
MCSTVVIEVDAALELAEQTEVQFRDFGRGRRTRRSQTGQQRPDSEVAESSRSMTLSTRRGR